MTELEKAAERLKVAHAISEQKRKEFSASRDAYESTREELNAAYSEENMAQSALMKIVLGPDLSNVRDMI